MHVFGNSCVRTDDKQLETAVTQGHKWWVLSEKLPHESAEMISNYRNSDQNSNQVSTETKLKKGSTVHACALPWPVITVAQIDASLNLLKLLVLVP